MKEFADVIFAVRDETSGTVLMNCRIGDKKIPIWAFDRARTEKGFISHIVKSRIIKTKIRTGTKIAVQIFSIVAFFLFRVERTEIRLIFCHVFKPKIFYHFVVA